MATQQNGASSPVELSKRMEDYIRGIPKAELHVHIEGTLEPKLMFQLAARNNVALKGTVESHTARRRNFKDLQDFLDLYYDACKVLKTEIDFYDLMYSYLRRASVDNVYAAEVFFDPQTHTGRGIPISVIINGLYAAIVDGYRDFTIRASLILCFLRDRSEAEAFEILEKAKPHLSKITGVGLDSAEAGNPPSKFERVYKMAAGLGLKLVAHAGEEAGPPYILEALDLLRVQRVDHGVQCLKDPNTIQRLVEGKIPLTTCPLSNQKLQVLSRYFNGHSVTKELLRKGITVTVNSDDPAYFGGYITDNFLHLAKVGEMDEKDVCQICKNAFNSTFLSEIDKQFYLQKIDKFNVTMGCVAPPKSITFFGSRKPRAGSEEYERCARAARLAASRGFKVVNGGYSGLMEAASFGANDAENSQNSNSPSLSVGVLAPCVFCERSADGNSYLGKTVFARTLSERVERLIDSSEYFVVCGGTIGTLTELLFAWNVASVRPMSGRLAPKIYVLQSFWESTLKTLMSAIGMYTNDCGLLEFVESEEEMVMMVEKDWEKRSANAIM